MRSRELDAGAATPWAASTTCPRRSTRGSRRELERLPRAERRRRRGHGASTGASTRAPARSRPSSNYFYSTCGEADEAPPRTGKPRVVILGSRPEPDRPGDRVRLLLRPRGAELPRAGLRGGDGQLQPGDRLDRLRHLRPALLRAARRRGGARRAASASSPWASCIQFGGQTPLKLARAIEARRLPDPRHAVRRDRPRRGPRALRRAARGELGDPLPGVGDRRRAARGRRDRRRGSATRCSSGRRTCSAAARCASATRRRGRSRRSRGLDGPVLVDRFLENAIEIDVDALCDGEETYVAAVMQHVEEAGVHSGDSSCVLPAPSLTPTQAREIEDVVRRLAPALGVVGLLNVQLAIADGERLRARGEPARVAHGAVRVEGDRDQPRRGRVPARRRRDARAISRLPPERPPTQVSVKAAVLPFARFPGSDPVLGPEMRSTGEVMASRGRLRRPRSRRPSAPPAGRCRRRAPRSSPCATQDKPAVVPVAAPSPASASSSSPPAARRGRCSARASRSSRSRRSPRAATRPSSTSFAGGSATSSSTRRGGSRSAPTAT